MYHEKPVMPKSKKISLIVSAIIILWIILFIVDYSRFSNGKKPIFILSHSIKYDDGVVVEGYGLGYVYRKYDREAIIDTEFGPFWLDRRNPLSASALPTAASDYEVPENPNKTINYRGIVYFYTNGGGLLGTYKCLNSTVGCTKAVSGHDEFDISHADPLNLDAEETVMSVINSKFGFVDDSEEQVSKYGDADYIRTIYFYDIETNTILARFADVKYSVLNEKTYDGDGENKHYIVKDWDTKKWGVISIDPETGKMEQVLDYEYDSINYDIDAEYYILDKEGTWYVYDLDRAEKKSIEMSEPIYNVWINDNKTTYFASGTLNQASNHAEFKIYRADGNEFLLNAGIVSVYPRGKYLLYIDRINKKAIFMDYSKEIKDQYDLSFTELFYDKMHNPAFKITKQTSSQLEFYIYQSDNLYSGYDVYAITTTEW